MSEIPRIITADCSFPKEIDDGLFVEPLDENHELYKVGVCVVDTSKLYSDQDIVKQAFARTSAKYWDLPGDERGYDPMIDTEIIKGLEFTAGSVRDALIVTFLVGAKQGPSEVDISFGKVEVVENKSYKEFSSHGTSKKFSRASQLIKGHLGYVAYGDHAGHRPKWREDIERKETTSNISAGAWKRGSQMNEAFMVATNHLVGSLLEEEKRPAAYRVYDPDDERYVELVSPRVALFSQNPGPHAALKLRPYCRVTSPLRRLDDFVMNYQLKQRFLGKQPTAFDAREVGFAVRRLNQEIIASAPKEVSRYSRQDILGRSVGRLLLPPAVGE